MRIRRPRWRVVGAVALAVLVVLPGWRGTFVPADHEEILAAAARARRQTGVSRPGVLPGEQWHLQYLDSWWVLTLDELGLRRSAPALVPPDFAAHLPPGELRADGYYRVESSLRWPWWLPGGGMDWGAPGPR